MRLVHTLEYVHCHCSAINALHDKFLTCKQGHAKKRAFTGGEDTNYSVFPIPNNGCLMHSHLHFAIIGKICGRIKLVWQPQCSNYRGWQCQKPYKPGVHDKLNCEVRPV